MARADVGTLYIGDVPTLMSGRAEITAIVGHRTDSATPLMPIRSVIIRSRIDRSTSLM
jgi:hypothetical protein